MGALGEDRGILWKIPRDHKTDIMLWSMWVRERRSYVVAILQSLKLKSLFANIVALALLLLLPPLIVKQTSLLDKANAFLLPSIHSHSSIILPSNHRPSLSNIPHNPRPGPNKRIPPLIPIHKRPSARNPRHSRPASPKHNIMLLIKEVLAIRRVQRHRAVSLVYPERRGGPLPEPAKVALTAELARFGRGRIEFCGGAGDGAGMPACETNVSAFEGCEDVPRVWTTVVHTVCGSALRWRLLYAVIGEMSVHSWDGVLLRAGLAGGRITALCVDVGVDAAGFFDSGNAAAEPGCAAGEFVVGGADGPVKAV